MTDMESAEIKRSIRELYMTYPFPQTTRAERESHLVFALCKYRFLGLDEAMRGARVLDVGCGTGRNMLVAKHYDLEEYVGLDNSSASLRIACAVAREDGVDRFRPVEGDLFAMPFADDSFDVVVSWGVLHHTGDPLRGLREMARVCRPGGFVAHYVYNKWNHWRHNRQKNRIDRLAGPDIEERFKVAHRLYGIKPIEAMTPGEKVSFYDRYCVPYKSEHTFAEVLSWFDALGLEYWGSSRPLRFLDFIRYLQYMERLLDRRSADARGNGMVRTAVGAARLAGKLPRLSEASPPFRRPGLAHRMLWQMVLAWQGRDARQSQSASFSARKPLRNDPSIDFIAPKRGDAGRN